MKVDWESCVIRHDDGFPTPRGLHYHACVEGQKLLLRVKRPHDDYGKHIERYFATRG